MTTVPPAASASLADDTAVPQRGLTTLLGLVLPLLVAVVAAAVALSWRSELPDPVATHWQPEGVNGTGDLTALVLLVTLGNVVSVAGGWALAFFAGRSASVRRSGVAAGLGVVVFLSGVLLGTLQIQKGLADAYAAPDPDGAIAVAMLVGLVAAALAALAIRPDPPRPAGPRELPTSELTLPPNARVAWVQEVRVRALTWLALGVGVGLVVIGVVAGNALLLVPIALLVALLLLAFSSVTVTVDERGLRAAGTFGWPRLTVPADEVLEVKVVAVNPITEFGGWGYRVGRGGKIGVVLRSGQAIEVHRTGGRVAVVTVDDAATGAALLQALAARTAR